MLRPNQTVSLSSLADLRPLMADLPGPDQEAVAAVQAREPQLTKPPKSLGRLESLTEWLAAWQGRSLPGIYHPVCRIFAGNHGVADLGVSAFPAAVTEQMVLNFEHGGAAINQLA
ncbi:MAG: nicotinate-nucleotide--dimethylbenzimidazole phosphoribosyltransferase, partial [Rhodospirillaceae bacterium]